MHAQVHEPVGVHVLVHVWSGEWTGANTSWWVGAAGYRSGSLELGVVTPADWWQIGQLKR